MKNCNISNSKSSYGSIFFIVENYQSQVIIEGCLFVKNFGSFNLIDLGRTNLEIYDSIFENNSNLVFYLIDSFLNIKNCSIINNKCLTTDQGCFLSAFQFSVIVTNATLVKNVSNELEEGIIYLEKSTLQTTLLQMIELTTKKKKGSCFSIYSSNLTISFSNFSKYNYNCLFGIDSSIEFSNCIFNNSDFIRQSKIINNYGGIYCLSCVNVTILNSMFLKNVQILKGSSIYISGEKNEGLEEIMIENCIFLENEALEEGTLYIYNQNITIQKSNFTNNSAKRGGALFFNNDGNF